VGMDEITARLVPRAVLHDEKTTERAILHDPKWITCSKMEHPSDLTPTFCGTSVLAPTNLDTHTSMRVTSESTIGRTSR
jgi:hypothetical protein